MRYISTKTVAHMLQISKPTLYRWVKANKIPHLRRGHRILFDEAQVIKWMESSNPYRKESFYNQLNAT